MSKTEAPRAPTPAIEPPKPKVDWPEVRLRAITIRETPRIPGLRADVQNRIDCMNPAAPLKGWRLIVRGPDVLLVTTPGWVPDETMRRRAKDTDRSVVHVIPRILVVLELDGPADKVAQGVPPNFESLPFGWTPPEPEAPAEKGLAAMIPPHEMGDD